MRIRMNEKINNVELVATIQRDPHTEEAYTSFSQLVADNVEKLYVFARSRGLSKEESDIIVQDTFINVYNRIDTIDLSKMSFHAYLRAIATHKILDRHRREQALIRGEEKGFVGLDVLELEALIPSEDNVEQQLIEKERKEETKSLLNKLLERANLSATERKVIELSRQGYTSSEVAKQLKTSSSYVYNTRSKAMRKLSKVIEESFPEI